MKNPRVIFAGTPEFALASLSALVDSGTVPVAVLTQPDRPAGRGKRVTANPVKRFAEEQGIRVMQPTTLRDQDIVSELAALEPDAIIVAAYGLILPQEVLDVPARACINVHASVLPRWRGAAPIQAAILAGDETSGVSLMSMTAGLDCGPVFVTEQLTIAAGETGGSLHDRLAVLGAETLVANLDGILEKHIAPVEQDEAIATYAGKIKKSDARLDWFESSVELERRVRAYNPVPGAFFFADVGETAGNDEAVRIKCWSSTSIADVDAAPGTVVASAPGEIVVACDTGGLSLRELQMPGKRRVQAREITNQFDLTGRELS